uniref:Uncharacterized protein n=1 Tax=Aegilops tauschii subsp. strangulata TaxID=200361 RepID=A0A453AUF2_AEGTS
MMGAPWMRSPVERCIQARPPLHHDVPASSLLPLLLHRIAVSPTSPRGGRRGSHLHSPVSCARLQPPSMSTASATTSLGELHLPPAPLLRLLYGTWL